MIILQSLLFANSSWKKEFQFEEVLIIGNNDIWILMHFKDKRVVPRVAKYDRMPS